MGGIESGDDVNDLTRRKEACSLESGEEKLLA